MKNLFEKIKWKDGVYFLKKDQKRSWETTAIIYYKDNPKYKKAVAAGKALDGALNKEKSRFLTDQYLKYFINDTLFKKRHDDL